LGEDIPEYTYPMPKDKRGIPFTTAVTDANGQAKIKVKFNEIGRHVVQAVDPITGISSNPVAVEAIRNVSVRLISGRGIE
jgi:hypothetical protein